MPSRNRLFTGLSVSGMRQISGDVSNDTCHQGFTLLEILVAISIFAIVATMIYSSFNAVLSKNEAIKENTAVFEMANNTLHRMSMDLKGTFVEQYPEYQVPDINDPPDPYRFHVEEAHVGGRKAATLSFVSSEHLPISSIGISGLARIRYYAEPSDNARDDTFVIKRSDTAFPYDIDLTRRHETDRDPVICKNVESFVLTLVDMDGQLHPTWDSDSERHQFSSPRAVILEIVIATENGRHEFTTRVDIPVYREKLENVRR